MFAKLFGVMAVLIIGGALCQIEVLGWTGVIAACFTVFLILKLYNSLDVSSQRADYGYRGRNNRPAHYRRRR